MFSNSKKNVRPWEDPDSTRLKGWQLGKHMRAQPVRFSRTLSEKEAQIEDKATQAGQKRQFQERGSEAGTSDVPIKRAKSEHTGGNALGISAEDLLDMASSSALKKICVKLMGDETTGPRIRAELLAFGSDIMAGSKSHARRVKDAIIRKAKACASELAEKAQTKKGCTECEDWPETMKSFFPEIEALHDLGSLVEGPRLAWEALIEVATLCTFDWDGGGFTYGAGEDDCDEFHDEVDRFMLFICQNQEKDGQLAWLRGGRKEEVWKLQENVQYEPCTYRYQNTLEFLEQV